MHLTTVDWIIVIVSISICFSAAINSEPEGREEHG